MSERGLSEMNKNFLKNESGTLLASFVIILSVLSSILLYAASASLANRIGIENSYNKTVATSVAEGGIEKAIWAINSGQSYSGDTASSSIPGGEFDVVVTNIDTTNKYIVSTAYVPTKANPKYKKAIKIKLSALPSNTDISFSYAVQAGQGGMVISGSSHVEGSLYSNADIVVSGSAEVNDPGNAWAVGTITDGGRIAGTKTPGAPAVPLPTLDLEAWKNLAKTGGTITGNYNPSGNVTVGPKEITGNVTMGTANVTLDGPLYVHGDFSMSSGSASMRPSNNVGADGTMVVVDGKINITGGKFFENSDKGYIVFVSTNPASTESNPAISYTGNNEAERVAFYAYNGAMRLAGSGQIAAMIAQTLFINGSGKIEYEHGTPAVYFPGAPGGSWEVLEWQEVRAP